jgi:microcystin-dependent protein
VGYRPARIYNSISGSSIDFQLSRSGVANTTLRVVDGKIGVNVLAPDVAVDVDGDIKLTGTLVVANTNSSTNLLNGSFRTAGGAAISKNLIIGETLEVRSSSSTRSIIPLDNDVSTLGSNPASGGRRWNEVWAKTIRSETIQGTLQGNIVGNASSSTKLQLPTTFRMTGDITAPPIRFDGQLREGTEIAQEKVFRTQLTAAIISGRPEVTSSRGDDQLLTFRPGAGLLRQTRNNFIGDLGVPIGAIMPYAGNTIPNGYLLCDGSEVERTRFPELFDAIGNIYGVPTVGVNTFRLPDLRGRFPLGRDNMDNGRTVPTSLGNFVDAGGGNIDRVQGTAADNIGGTGGNSTNTLIVDNLPQHEHNMQGSTGTQYYAVRIDTAAPLDIGSFSNRGPNLAGTMQYVPTSGGVRSSNPVGQAFAVMNPYLTINYIIRSGPAAF